MVVRLGEGVAGEVDMKHNKIFSSQVHNSPRGGEEDRGGEGDSVGVASASHGDRGISASHADRGMSQRPPLWTPSGKQEGTTGTTPATCPPTTPAAASPPSTTPRGVPPPKPLRTTQAHNTASRSNAKEVTFAAIVSIPIADSESQPEAEALGGGYEGNYQRVAAALVTGRDGNLVHISPRGIENRFRRSASGEDLIDSIHRYMHAYCIFRIHHFACIYVNTACM
jgi:hypothetical protein